MDDQKKLNLKEKFSQVNKVEKDRLFGNIIDDLISKAKMRKDLAERKDNKFLN